VIGLYKTVYECEVITPMFLRGGDNKTCDIRPPAIKGAMRFWFRALIGNIPENKIRTMEKILFGGINGEGSQTGQRSPFSIHVKIPGEKIETISVSPTPHKGPKGERDAVKPGVVFTVELFVLNNKTVWANGGELSNEKILEIIGCIFEQTAIFGGLGMRSRRGFGAFKITKKNGKVFSMNQVLQTFEEAKDSTKGNHQTAYEEHWVGKKKFDNPFDLVCFVGAKSHEIRKKYGNGCNNSLGTGGEHRLASPVIVSAIPVTGSEKLRLIMTCICSQETSRGIQIQDEFMDMLDGKRY